VENELTEKKNVPLRSEMTSWESILPYFEELEKRNPGSVVELEKWLKDRSNLEEVLQEDLGWRYIRQTCDTTSISKRDALNFFISEIEPHAAEYSNRFNKKLLASPFLRQLDKDKYFVYLRGIEKEVELFRNGNIPLFTEIQTLSNEYGRISGEMSVEVDGETLTFQQAANYLKSTDRAKRKEVYEKINRRRQVDRDRLEDLFDKLLKLRHQVAVNAGFKNFRDYMFEAMGRFDYTPEHCYDFHNSVEKHIVPLISSFEKERKAKLKLDTLYPWDLEVDADQLPALAPFTDSEDLITKTVAVFSKVNPFYGEVITLMHEKGHLDLDSRLGKAPGGYNYPLYASALPFIFMNSAGSMRDMVTMMHEGGHALHSWVSRNLELTGFKNMPSEMAEVASMSMELISMEHWQEFFKGNEELKRARKYQLEKILSILPWIATIDCFQHWVYTHPEHTREERKSQWLAIYGRFSGAVVDRSLYPDFESLAWHRQLHVFEVPFYYIEYGIAQLAAIGIWRNYKTDPKKALMDYENALSLGYLKTLPDLYQIAGIRFDFSEDYVRELADSVKKELG